MPFQDPPRNTGDGELGFGCHPLPCICSLFLIQGIGAHMCTRTQTRAPLVGVLLRDPVPASGSLVMLSPCKGIVPAVQMRQQRLPGKQELPMARCPLFNSASSSSHPERLPLAAHLLSHSKARLCPARFQQVALVASVGRRWVGGPTRRLWRVLGAPNHGRG